MSKKIMKLINPYNGYMKCMVCGYSHYANYRPGFNGRCFRRGSWQCVNKCKLEDLAKENQNENH